MAAWKVAREACAFLKQSQLIRLFVPENLPMLEPARLLSILDHGVDWIVVGVIPQVLVRLDPLNPQLEPTLEPWLSFLKTPPNLDRQSFVHRSAGLVRRQAESLFQLSPPTLLTD